MDIEERGQSNQEIYGRLYRCYKTVCEMMLDRGYISQGTRDSVMLTEDKIKWLEEVGPEGFIKDFQQKFQDLSSASANFHSDTFATQEGNIILVYFRKDPLTRGDLVNAFQAITNYTQNNNCTGKVILILPGDIEKSHSKLIEQKDSKTLRSQIDMLRKQNELEIFDQSNLVYNITRHNLVPKHIPLNDTEKSELLQKYKITPNQLPKILITDPVAKYFGMRRGDVFKIIRTSETAGKYVTYRICV